MKVDEFNVKEVLEVLAPVQVTWNEHMEIFQVHCEGVEIHDGRSSLTSAWGGDDTRAGAMMDYFYQLASLEKPSYIVRTVLTVPGVEHYRLKYAWNGSGFSCYSVAKRL